MRLTPTALLGVFAFPTTSTLINGKQDQASLGTGESAPVQQRSQGREQLRQRGASYVERAPLWQCPHTRKSKTVLGKYVVHLFPGYNLEAHVDAVGEKLKEVGIRVQESGYGERGAKRVAYELEGVNEEVFERVRGESGVEWVSCVNEGTVEAWGRKVEGEWDIDGEGLLVWRKDETATGQEESYLARMRCEKPGYLMKHIEGTYVVDLWPGISLDEHVATVQNAGLKPIQVEWNSQQGSQWTAEHVGYSADNVSDELLLAIRKDKNVESIGCVTTVDWDQKDTEEGRSQAIREWEEEHYTSKQRQRIQDWDDIYGKYKTLESMTIQEKIDASRAWYEKYPEDFEELGEEKMMMIRDWYKMYDGWDEMTAEERLGINRQWWEKYPIESKK